MIQYYSYQCPKCNKPYDYMEYESYRKAMMDKSVCPNCKKQDKKEDVTAYSYADALIDPVFIVCGVRLQPFSLGKMILLQKINSPALSATVVDKVAVGTTKKDALFNELSEFFFTVLLCGISYKDGMELIADDDLMVKEFKKFTDNLDNVLKNSKEWSFQLEANRFKAYLKYYLDMPVYQELNDSGGVASGTDWKTNIITIFRKLGMDDNTIFDMSTKRLFYEWCSYAEGEGAIKVMNKNELGNNGKIKLATITVTENKK